jgi:hypothetical protein
MATAATWSALTRMLLAGTVAVLSIWAAMQLADQLLGGGEDARPAYVRDFAISGVTGLGTYVLAARILRIDEVSRALGMVTGRLRRRG